MTKCSLRSSNSTDEAILGQMGRVARLPRPRWHVSINEAQFLGGRPSLTRITERRTVARVMVARYLHFVDNSNLLIG